MGDGGDSAMDGGMAAIIHVQVGRTRARPAQLNEEEGEHVLRSPMLHLVQTKNEGEISHLGREISPQKEKIN